MYAFFTSLENDLGEVETLCFRFYNVHISYQSVNSCYGNGSEYCRNMFAIKRVVIFINFLNSVEYNSEKQRYHYMKSVWHFNLHIAFISLSIDVNRLSVWDGAKINRAFTVFFVVKFQLTEKFQMFSLFIFTNHCQPCLVLLKLLCVSQYSFSTMTAL